MKEKWEAIKSKYPNQHVIIENPVFSNLDISTIEEGELIDHDATLDDLLKRCSLSKFNSYALKYTGDIGEAIGQRGMIRVIEND